MSFNGKVPQEAHILYIKQQTSFAHLLKNNNKKTNEPCFRSYLIRFQKMGAAVTPRSFLYLQAESSSGRDGLFSSPSSLSKLTPINSSFSGSFGVFFVATGTKATGVDAADRR